MPYLPELTEMQQSRSLIEAFGGLNHNLKISEGEWYCSENLSSARYPIFSERGRRGVYVDALVAPKTIIARDALAYVDGTALIYNGLAVPGVTLSAEGEKQLVSMGAYLCIFPDGIYVNTANLSDYGYMAATYQSASNAQITYSPCRKDGTEYDSAQILPSTTEPTEPENGDYWLDTSADTHALKQYSASSSMWVEIPTVYAKISVSGIGALFGEGDGVTISGAAYSGTYAALEKQIAALNTDALIQARGDDSIIVVGLIDQMYVQSAGQIKIERRVPKMQYVCEANNRLWGCYYGMGGGKTINEIYACKQGDFKNWNCFAGISTDSYSASVGTDGEFTGCIAHLGYPLFFKENCIHKMYGNFPSNFQLQTTTARGVQRGSWASLAIVNEVLYYKSKRDVCAYDGTLPTGISSQLGDDWYGNAVAGAQGGNYYLSMQDASEKWHLFLYDTVRGIWQREDAVQAGGFAAWGNELYILDAGNKRILSEFGTVGTLEGKVEWFAESGMIGFEMIDQKYISRFMIRMKLGAGATCALEIEYDSDGIWRDQGAISGGGTDSFLFPVIPMRCDHFRIRLSGRGEIRIFSMAKIIEQGSDGMCSTC